MYRAARRERPVGHHRLLRWTAVAAIVSDRVFGRP